MSGRLTVVEGPNRGATFVVRDGAVIGRALDCAVRLSDLHVSRRHAKIVEHSGRMWLEDLGSGNGTQVNEHLVKRHALTNGDLIRLKSVVLLFEELIQLQEPKTELVTMVAPRPDGQLHIVKSIDAIQVPITAEALEDVGAARTAAARLTTVLGVSQAIGSILELDALLPEILTRVLGVFQSADRAVIMMVDEAGELVPRAVRQQDGAQGGGIAVSNTILSSVIQKKQALLTHDAMADERFHAGLSVASLRIRAAMCAPLLFRGDALGALYVSSPVLASFNAQDLELLAAIASQAALAVGTAKLHEELLKRQRLDRDLQLAERIQKSFLPQSTPQLAGYSFAAWYDPAFEIGGDFYDFLELKDGRVGIVIGDVSGKGVSAALYMARLMRDLHAVATADSDPSHVLERLNTTVIDSGHDDLFVTMLFAVLDPKLGTLRFANAGHMPPLIRSATGMEVRDSVSGLPLGVMPNTTFASDALELGPGDVLLLYTDGLVEAMNDSREMYGAERLRVAFSVQDGSAQDTLDALLKEVEAHVGDAAQFDDTTVVCLGCDKARLPKRVRPPVSPTRRP
ncbi:MAG: SpoIIE family protein phosphatase [Deltaproteobacteria bacterium]|nr:SpoIIE family protein phosphatase [Deltaproteobacteria bacterium]